MFPSVDCISSKKFGRLISDRDFQKIPPTTNEIPIPTRINKPINKYEAVDKIFSKSFPDGSSAINMNMAAIVALRRIKSDKNILFFMAHSHSARNFASISAEKI